RGGTWCHQTATEESFACLRLADALPSWPMTHARPDDPDAPLVLRAGAGDASACAQLVDRWLAPVHRMAARVLGNAAGADEGAQDAFLRVWEHAPRWKPDAKFSTWLFRIAHNLCMDRIRARRPGDDAALDA